MYNGAPDFRDPHSIETAESSRRSRRSLVLRGAVPRRRREALPMRRWLRCIDQSRKEVMTPLWRN